jgi:hypothetical protein
MQVNRSLGAASRRIRLHQLDSVTEGIVDEHAAIAAERFIRPHRMAGICQGGRKLRQSVDDESGVRFARRPKVRLDTKVDFQRPAFEPAATAWRAAVV